MPVLPVWAFVACCRVNFSSLLFPKGNEENHQHLSHNAWHVYWKAGPPDFEVVVITAHMRLSCQAFHPHLGRHRSFDIMARIFVIAMQMAFH
jgi:hypothetical protein